jgi:hypothetical protein
VSDTSNPYRVVQDGLGIHVIRYYDDGEEFYLVQVESVAEGQEIADAEWDREKAGGVIP